MRVLAIEDGRKKSKLAVEEGVVASLATEDDFHKAAVTLSATVFTALAPTLMVTKNKICSKDFRPRMGLR